MAEYVDLIKTINIEAFKNKSKDKLYSSVLENTLIKLYNNSISSFEDTIKNTLISESDIFWSMNEQDVVYQIDRVEELKQYLKNHIDNSQSVIQELLDRLNKYISGTIGATNSFLTDDNTELIENNTKDIYFAEPFYHYTNLQHSAIKDSILLDFSRITKYITTGEEFEEESESPLMDINQEEDILPKYKSRKEKVNYFMNYYGISDLSKVNGHIFTPKEIIKRYNFIPSVYESLYSSFRNDARILQDSLLEIENIFNAEGLNRYSVSEYRNILLNTENMISSILDLYIIDLATRLDAILGFIETNNSIITEVINQLTTTYKVYDVPNDLNDEINDVVDMQDALEEINSAMIYNNTVITLEAAGQIIVNEETLEKTQMYFEKVIQGAQQVIQKIIANINTNISKRIAPVLVKLKNKNKPVPEFIIIHAKEVNFIEIENITPTPFRYDIMKDYAKNKEDFINQYYPKLKPTNINNSIYKVMRDIAIRELPSVKCTPELIDEYTNFLVEDYKKHLDGLDDFTAAIDDASKKVLNITKMSNQDASKEVENIQQQEQPQQQTEAAVMEADGKLDNTSFKDDPATRKSAQGDTMIMKASVVYCSVLSEILSSRLKLLNYIYKDRLKVVMHYVNKSGLENKKENNR